MQLDRRNLLRSTLACGLSTSILGSGAIAAAGEPLGVAPGSDAMADDPEIATLVSTGVQSYQRLAVQQHGLCRALTDAIASGDLAAARTAYIASRPPYEEIETLANVFMDIDRDIDARPYVFENGETDNDFRGFHKIEALLFGWNDVEAALPYAERLQQSVNELTVALGERGRFSASLHFDGMIALATEVAAKKISSEEETWSDQSLLIFRHNWRGIARIFEPFSSALGSNSSSFAAYRTALTAGEELLAPYFKPGVVGASSYRAVGNDVRRQIGDTSNRLRDALVQARGDLRL